MERIVNTKFYQFSQNNSGGWFDNQEAQGICEYVIIEAINADHANARAEEIGLYFEGCSYGADCSCCGDRWYRVDDSDGEDEPCLYGTPVRGRTKDIFRDSCFIHYLDGKFEKVEFKESK